MTNQKPIFRLLARVINVAVDMVMLWFCDLMISFMNNTVTTGTVYRPEPPRPEAIYSFVFNLYNVNEFTKCYGEAGKQIFACI